MPPEFQPFPKKWAVLIGVNKYRHVPPLKFGRQDALDFADTLHRSLQFEKDNILTFVEGSDYPPERATIFHYLGEVRTRGNIGEDDLLVFFFSGHGMIGTDDSKDYLLPLDATPFNLLQTAIKIEDITSELTRTNCKNVVMFIDACREQVSGEKGIVTIGEDAIDAVTRAGIVTFFSCDPKLKSYELAPLGHGSFTHCILEAISRGEGKTVASLYSYLKREVPIVNANHEMPFQRPYAVIIPAEKGDLPIFLNTRQARIDFDALRGGIGDLSSEGKLEDEYLNKIIEFLDAEEKSSTEEGVTKLLWIEKLSTRKVIFRAFKVVWDSLERRRTISGTVQDKLEKLPPEE